MSADPFANTTTVKNILQHVISPKIVKDNAGGYVTKTDLVNVHNLVFSETATGQGTIAVPLTAQCGLFTLPSSDAAVFFCHARVTPNSVILANVMTSFSPGIGSIEISPDPLGFAIRFADSTGGSPVAPTGTQIGWFIAAF